MAKAPTGQVFEKMQTDYQLADTDVEKATAALTKAIENAKRLTGTKNENLLGEGFAELKEARELVPGALEKVAVARASAIAAGYDMPSVKDHKEEILAAIEKAVTWKKQLLKLDTAAEKQYETNVNAEDKVYELSDQYAAWVSQMKKITTELAPDQASVRAALDGFHAKALKAVETRNANSLELAKSDAESLNTKRFEEGLAKLKDLAKKAEDANLNVTNETRKEKAFDFGRSRGDLAKLATDVEYFKERKKAIKAMKAVPLDIAKALKTLGVPAKHKDALAQALAGAGDEARCTKALDELAKQAKLDQSGKDMFAALKKAKVV